MNPPIIGEAWQAMSILSDAQEFLGDETFTHLDLQTRMVRANDHINHAKRHLQRLFELAQAEDPEAFVRGTLVMTCTLQDEKEEVTTDDPT